MKKYYALSGAVLLLLFSLLSYSHITQDQELSQLMKLNEKQRQEVEKLYTKWYSGPLHALLTAKVSSKAIGKWAKSGLSRWHIPKFINKYNIDVSEISRPVKTYKSLNDFFIRKLKPGARPLPADPTALISPADGNVFVIPRINGDTQFPIKAVTLSAEKMLKDPDLAQQFKNGTAVIIRLAPWDYHRVHFPLDGIPLKAQRIAGRFESVSPAVYEAGIQPLEVNERHLIRFQSDKAFTVAIVLVGATFVGAIKETYLPRAEYKQGDELGYFEFGGSTMVMLFQKNTVKINQAIIDASAEGKETPVKMGEVIGQVIAK